jgi:dual specificity phosphatase 12
MAALGAITYLRLGLADTRAGAAQLLPAVRAATAFIDGAVASRTPVLVHCSAGLSRSVAVVAGYLMARERLGADAALARLAAEYSVHGARPRPNAGFVEALRAYQAELGIE